MTQRRIALAVTAALLLAFGQYQPTAQSPARPGQLLVLAMDAMGGAETLESLRAIRLETIGHHYALEQSERPEGPWLVVYRQIDETRDYEGSRFRSATQNRFWSSATWGTPSPLIVSDGVAARTNGELWAPGTAASLEAATEALDLSPERLLLTARAASDLAVEAPVTLHGVAHDVLRFTWHDTALLLHFNRWTHLPTLLELRGNDDRFDIWGDVVERRWYSFWTLETGGLMIPRQTTIEWNGLPYSDTTVMDATVNPELDDSQFAIPDETRAEFRAAAGRPTGMASIPFNAAGGVEIAPGITQYTGSWNILVVRQADGLVVIESPIGNTFSKQVLESLAAEHPDVPIKAVVTTSDAWPHLGGIREYVARGIPVHALDLNVAILTRLVESVRSASPDALSGTRREPDWRVVSERTTVGDGDTRLELIPIRGEFGERMMAIWMPGPRLLYTSDMVQQMRDGSFFMPSMLAEIERLVDRESLSPDRVVAMHTEPLPWTDITSALADTRGGS